MNRNDKFSSFPGHTGVVGEMQHIILADEFWRDLLPQAPAEEWNSNNTVTDVLPDRKIVGGIWHQNFVLVCSIYSTERLNEPMRIPSKPNVEDQVVQPTVRTVLAFSCAASVV